MFLHQPKLLRSYLKFWKYLKPQPNVIAEGWKFYCRDQNGNETISDYIIELRKLTLNCNFREFLDEALRDRFVCRLINSNILQGLSLTLKTANDLVKTLESAEVETKLINMEIKAEMHLLLNKNL